jgi:hypothetical protein
MQSSAEALAGRPICSPVRRADGRTGDVAVHTTVVVAGTAGPDILIRKMPLSHPAPAALARRYRQPGGAG